MHSMSCDARMACYIYMHSMSCDIIELICGWLYSYTLNVCVDQLAFWLTYTLALSVLLVKILTLRPGRWGASIFSPSGRVFDSYVE